MVGAGGVVVEAPPPSPPVQAATIIATTTSSGSKGRVPGVCLVRLPLSPKCKSRSRAGSTTLSITMRLKSGHHHTD